MNIHKQINSADTINIDFCGMIDCMLKSWKIALERSKINNCDHNGLEMLLICHKIYIDTIESRHIEVTLSDIRSNSIPYISPNTVKKYIYAAQRAGLLDLNVRRNKKGRYSVIFLTDVGRDVIKDTNKIFQETYFNNRMSHKNQNKTDFIKTCMPSLIVEKNTSPTDIRWKQ